MYTRPQNKDYQEGYDDAVATMLGLIRKELNDSDYCIEPTRLLELLNEVKNENKT